MLKVSKFLIAFAVLFISHSTWALTVCLHARSNNSPTSGHAFVTLQDKGRILESYGLWPNDKLTANHPNPVAINRPGDMPLEFILQKGFKVSEEIIKMTEQKVCSALKVSRQVLKTTVLSYTEKDHYGPYRTLSNNCTHFAINIFNYATGSDFPVVMSPKKTNAIISDLLQRGQIRQ